jgi:copper chaperone
MKRIIFKTNLHCGNCINAITPFLNELDNVDFWQVDLENPNKTLTVELDDEDEASVMAAVQKAGYQIEKI